MKTITLHLTDEEIKMLQLALEVQVDITGDSVTDDLHLPVGCIKQTFNEEGMRAMRRKVEEKIREMVAAQTLYGKVIAATE